MSTRVFSKVTFKVLADQWLDSQNSNSKPNSLACYNSQLISRLVPHFGDMPAHQIFPREVEKFKQKFGRRIASRTLKHDVKVLCAVLDTGVRLGHFEANPVQEVCKRKPRRWR